MNGQPIAVYENRAEVVVPPPSFVVIDNDEVNTSSTGTWSLKTGAQQYGSDYREAKKKASNTYRWTLNYSLGGDSDIYAWWVGGKGYSTNVEYTISYQNGTQTDVVVKSHKVDSGQWNYLGTYYFEGGANDYIEVSAANGKTSADAIRFLMPNDPTIQYVDETNFIHTDHLGTPRAVTDDAQTVVWRWDSTPFGEAAPSEDPDGDGDDFILNLRFPGQYYDVESGLYYNYFRDYDPGTGRYVESDPIGLAGGLNSFEYVVSSPILLSDSFGMEPDCGGNCCKNVQWKEKESGVVGGTVRCCGGSPTACINPDICRNLSVEACRVRTKCTTRHEQLHADKHASCAGRSDGDPAGIEPPYVKASAECEAYRDSVTNCLSTRKCHGNRTCIAEVKKMQRFAERQRNKYCKAAGM